MPHKNKTKKAIAKRIKVTGTGKLMRRVPGSGHLKSRKSAARLRRMRQDRELPPMFAKIARKLLGM